MWPDAVALLLIGYLCFSRSFAYLGLPPLHLFVGEIVLFAFLVAGPRVAQGSWLGVVLETSAFVRLKKLFLVLLGFGVFEMVRGIALGHPLLNSVRDLAFNYYPIYFFLGMWAGLYDRDFLRKCLHYAAWLNGFYGLLYIFALNRVTWHVPGVSSQVEPVPVFGQPMYSAPILLGLLAFEKDLRRVSHLVLLNVAVLIGMLIRAEWAAFAVGLLVWFLATKNIKRAALAGATVLLLIAMMYLSGFSYVGPETRGRTISARDLVGQVIAPFSKDLAGGYSSDQETLDLSEGTTVWRTLYWTEIWSGVHENPVRSLLGFGYGYSLGDLVSYLGVVDVRTPHNFLFYLLGYTGWVGVLLYVAFQVEIAKLLWRVHCLSRQPFGIALWSAMLVFALFTPFFEVPQGAIPFYLLTGCSCSLLFGLRNRGRVRRTPVLAPAS